MIVQGRIGGVKTELAAAGETPALPSDSVAEERDMGPVCVALLSFREKRGV
jgi:hypothetical protein